MLSVSEYIARKLGHEVEYRFQGSLWVKGRPPLFCGVCEVFQPKEGDYIIVALMAMLEEALAGYMRARCGFVISKGRHDLYISEEIYPYELRTLKMVCPLPWDEPCLLLKLEQVRKLEGVADDSCL